MGIFGKIKRGLKRIGKAIGKVIGKIVGVVASPFSTSPSIPAMTGDQGAQIVDGIQLNFQGGAQPIPIVYGHRLIGGTRVFVSTNGTDNKYLYVAIVLAEGQCKGLIAPVSGSTGQEALIIDDNPVELSSYAHGVVATPTGGVYKDRLKVQFFDGRDDQVSASDGSGVFSDIDSSGGAPGWTTDHKLSGLCYYAMRFEWQKATTTEEANNNPYKGIPDIKVRLYGKIILDAMKLSSGYTTAYATGISNEANSANPTFGDGSPRSGGQYFGDDPASVLLDYLMNPRYGKNMPISSIDVESFRRNSQLNSTNSIPRFFQCSVVINPNETMVNNIKIILQSMRGYLPYANGQYRLVIDKPEDSTVSDSGAFNQYSDSISNITTLKTFNDDNIVGGISIERPDKTQRFNRVRVTYADGTNNAGSTESVFPESSQSTFAGQLVGQDNEEVLETSITLPWCTSEARAKLFAEMFINKSRNSLTLTFATNLSASNLIPTDLITVVNTDFGIDGPFRIVDMQINENGLIVITAVEHQPTVFQQDLNNFATQNTTPVLNLPNPFLVTGVTNLAAVTEVKLDGNGNKTFDLVATWTDSTDPFLENYVVTVTNTTERTGGMKHYTDENSIRIPNVRLGTTFTVAVVAKNELGRTSTRSQVNTTITDTYTPASGSATAVTTNTVSTSIGETELSS